MIRSRLYLIDFDKYSWSLSSFCGRPPCLPSVFSFIYYINWEHHGEWGVEIKWTQVHLSRYVTGHRVEFQCYSPETKRRNPERTSVLFGESNSDVPSIRGFSLRDGLPLLQSLIYGSEERKPDLPVKTLRKMCQHISHGLSWHRLNGCNRCSNCYIKIKCKKEEIRDGVGMWRGRTLVEVLCDGRGFRKRVRDKSPFEFDAVCHTGISVR